MKKSIFMVALATMCVVSCSKEATSDSENSSFNSNKKSLSLDFPQDVSNHSMSADEPLAAFVNNSYYHYKGITNIGTIQEYIADDILTEHEKNTLYLAYGYDNNEEFLAYYENQNSLATAIEEEYNFSEMDESMKLEIINPFVINSPFNPQYEEEGCQERYNNCFIGATAIFVLESAGCAALDLTVVLGLMCHAAATTHYYTMKKDCDFALEDCQNN